MTRLPPERQDNDYNPSHFTFEGRNGAGERNRTPDRLITNQLLYLLSYASLDQIEADDYLLITHPV
jgi:hypothetical protein